VNVYARVRRLQQVLVRDESIRVASLVRLVPSSVDMLVAPHDDARNFAALRKQKEASNKDEKWALSEE
jgi:hypothetical protein